MFDGQITEEGKDSSMCILQQRILPINEQNSRFSVILICSK